MSLYRISQRAKDLVRKRGVECDCGAVEDQPHRPACALQQAFMECYDQAESEYYEHCEMEADIRSGR